MKTDFGKLTTAQMKYWDQKYKEQIIPKEYWDPETQRRYKMPEFGTEQAKMVSTGEALQDRPATPLEQMTSDIRMCTERLFGLSNSVRNTADRILGGSKDENVVAETAAPDGEYGQLVGSIADLQAAIARMQEQVDRFTNL